MSAKHTQRGQAARRSVALKAAPEVEMKFLIALGGLAAIKSSPIFMHKSTRVRLKSVYYDTADFLLHRGGLSLRVRHIKGEFIQTVKRRAGLDLFDRDEWESKITDERPDPSAWAETPVASILGDEGVDMLRPVFSTEVERTIRLWKERTSVIEVSLDQGKLVAGDLSEPIEEVELELKKGKVMDLFNVARRFGADAILRLSFDSKAERGYRMIGQERSTSQKTNALKISSDMAATAAFAQVARSCLAQVATNAELLRRLKTDEALHQLRVGLRRLQAAFSTFKPLFVRTRPARVKAETKWLMKELNPARDLDVFIANGFDKTKSDPKKGDSILSAFGERLLQARSTAYIRALAAVDSARFAVLLLDYAERVEAVRERRNVDSLTKSVRGYSASILASQALDRMRRQLRKKGKNLASMEPASRHKIRIRAKTLRYAGDFFAETFGDKTHKRRRRVIASLGALQKSLGQLSDLTSARRTAATVAGGSAELAFRAGRFVGARDRDESKLLNKAVQAYERWRGLRPFWG